MQSHYWWRWKNRLERHVCGRSYNRTEGGLQRLEYKKITCEPCATASFFLVMTFSCTLHDGYFFLFNFNAALHSKFLLVLHTLCREHLLRAPMLVYMGTFFYINTCPVLVYTGTLSYMPSASLHVKFFLHTPYWLLSLGSFSHTVYAGFFM